MICTAISESDFEKCKQLLENTDFAEIRLDLTGFNMDQIVDIFSLKKQLIATCRSTKENKNAREEILKTAITSGAKYVDIEIESDKYFKESIIKVARKNNCTVIISYHNFDLTPPNEELLDIVEKCFTSGADIAKIACMVNNVGDNARLLGILDTERPLVSIGMGEMGKITRIIAPFLGSVFTFASPNNEKLTAPGQINQQDMEYITELINKM
jgi:3-dehydroquinate dehydratase-1